MFVSACREGKITAIPEHHAKLLIPRTNTTIKVVLSQLDRDSGPVANSGSTRSPSPPFQFQPGRTFMPMQANPREKMRY